MRRSLALVLVMSIVTLLVIEGCSHGPESRLHVVATTTMMESAIKEIGGEHVAVTVLIPPGSCPGHYDIRPSDVRSIKRSRALFTHGYEQFVPRLLESAGDCVPKVCKVSVQGNWLIPDIYAEACHSVSRCMCGIDPRHAKNYRERYASINTRAAKISQDLREKLKSAGIEGTAVICSDQQAPFLKWMGLNVVCTYGRSEEFTPAQLHSLVKIGRDKKVRLVVDNLQSGPTAGNQLAKEIGASHLTLSNFPGGFPDTATWEKCLYKNVNMILSDIQGRQHR